MVVDSLGAAKHFLPAHHEVEGVAVFGVQVAASGVGVEGARFVGVAGEDVYVCVEFFLGLLSVFGVFDGVIV